MPTRYFKNSVDQNWDVPGNWWSNAACTEGFSGTLTGVNVTDTDTEVTCDSTAGLVVGRPITGDGIDTGTTVASITDGTTFELSQAAISTETSDLTCELHVIPVTADDVVIATGNGYVTGTPSSDVLGLVTVNGNSGLQVTLLAANFVFNDTSSNNGLLGNGNYAVATATFNDSSSNQGTIYSYNIAFNDSSYNSGSITGDVTFNDTSYTTGTINGNCTFTDSSYNEGTITGNCIFDGNSRNGNNSPVVNGIVNGDFTWGSSNYNYGTINGDCVGGLVVNGYPGVINGNCTVASGGTVYFNEGTINGDCDFLNGGYLYGIDGAITGNVTFSGNSYGGMYGGTINGDVTFNDSTALQGNGTITGTVTFNDSTQKTAGYIVGNTTFNDSSADTYGGLGTITGNCTFNDSCYTYGTITGDCTFNDSSYNNGTITGNATVRQHAAAFTYWRNYATSTYVTGTLTLQFPEMDILGTGLL
jgi:hypothetical protein